MPTFTHGRSTSIKLDNAAGTLTDISTYCDSVNLPQTVESFESTTFQATAKTYVTGFTEGTMSLSGKWHATIDTHMNALLGLANTVSFEYGPEGSTTGKVKKTGEAVMTSYNANSGVSDLSTWSAEFRISGAVTVGVFP